MKQTGLLGMTAAAGLMYFLDRDRGRRRRAIIRDKAASMAAHSGDTLRKVGRDLGNRATGTMATARSLIRREPEADDRVIEARVRSKMGHVVSHPSSIEVACLDGRVTMTGPILSGEVKRLMKALRDVPGVREVDNRLDVHDQAGQTPGLQGGRPRMGDVPELMQSNWTPAVRVLATAAGGVLAGYGLSRRDPAGMVMGLAGAGLVARALTNMETRRLIGAGAGRRVIDLRKTITIRASIEEVFRFWLHYENFPRFMSHIREVRDHGDGRSHWVADGPAGTTVSWDAEITRFEPNRILAWKSLPGSTVDNSGIIYFEPTPDGATRIHMQLSYNPPAGAVGHAVAWLLGRDLKTELDEDMIRLKSLIEEGKTRSRTNERVTRDTFEHEMQRAES